MNQDLFDVERGNTNRNNNINASIATQMNREHDGGGGGEGEDRRRSIIHTPTMNTQSISNSNDVPMVQTIQSAPVAHTRTNPMLLNSHPFHNVTTLRNIGGAAAAAPLANSVHGDALRRRQAASPLVDDPPFGDHDDAFYYQKSAQQQHPQYYLDPIGRSRYVPNCNPAGSGFMMIHPGFPYGSGENGGNNSSMTTTTTTTTRSDAIGNAGGLDDGTTVMVPMKIGAGAWGNPVPNSTFQQASFGNCCYMIIGWIVCCPVYICAIILVLIFVGAMTWDEIFDNPWE